MATNLRGSLAIILICSGFLCFAKDDSEGLKRNKKHFSLFSVVTFANEECTSLSTLTGGQRPGTCYTSTECSDKNGLESGNCAAGFGVCCLFIDATGTSSTIKENRTLVRNAEFPSNTVATAATTIAYTIQKEQDDICQIRLDFHAFTIAGPSNTVETFAAPANTHCQDTLTITATGGNTVPIICGNLVGEHLYIDLGTVSTDTAVLTLVTAVAPVPAVATRNWDIQISQLTCYAKWRAPWGCHRYYKAATAKITSFNFARTTGTTPAAAAQNSGIELGNQFLNTCIRREKGFCCTQYQVCTTFAGIALTEAITAGTANQGVNSRTINEAWSIDIDTSPTGIIDATMANAGLVDASCSTDYVGIPSSQTGTCGGHTSMGASVHSRYCGNRLGATYPLSIQSATANNRIDHLPVCDCSEPFTVYHFSNLVNDHGVQGAPAGGIGALTANGVPRGWCLDYIQTPCQT